MDPSFLRRQILGTPLTTSLPSGQSFYTLESLEGASSLPFLKPAPPASLPRRESLPTSQPVPLERDLRLDAQTRALLADRDARARLLAAEREALLRNLPGGATALQDQRMYTDTLDARARVSFDGLQNFDVISRAPPVVGGIAPGGTENGSLSELLRSRELAVGGHFLPAAGPTLTRRDIADWRAEAPNVGAQSARVLANSSREPPASRSGPAEANNIKYQAERNKGLSSSQPSSKSPAAKIKPPPEQSEGWCAVCKVDCQNIKTLGSHVKSKKHKAALPPEQSEGWCAVCKIDCHEIKSLGSHINGKKHKAAVEKMQGNVVKVEAASETVDKQVNSAPSTSQAVKKRASDVKAEMSQSTKRLKTSTPAITK